jgi:hypothetical protein
MVSKHKRDKKLATTPASHHCYSNFIKRFIVFTPGILHHDTLAKNKVRQNDPIFQSGGERRARVARRQRKSETLVHLQIQDKF